MSLVLKMIGLNTPLSQWRKFEANGREAGTYDPTIQTNLGWNGSKNPGKAAQSIFSQLSHDDAVALIAREFETLPAEIRMQLRSLCNEGNGSGNVRKGVQRLDRLLGGRLLKDPDLGQTFQVKTRDGWRSTKVNAAVAGATRKYGIVHK